MDRGGWCFRNVVLGLELVVWLYTSDLLQPYH